MHLDYLHDRGLMEQLAEMTDVQQIKQTLGPLVLGMLHRQLAERNDTFVDEGPIHQEKPSDEQNLVDIINILAQGPNLARHITLILNGTIYTGYQNLEVINLTMRDVLKTISVVDACSDADILAARDYLVELIASMYERI